MKKPTPSFSWEDLQKEREATLPVYPPPHSFTVRDYMERFCLTLAVARREIYQLVKAGKIKPCDFHPANRPIYYSFTAKGKSK